MWSTLVPKDQVLLFYFDDESKPRYKIPARAFYNGEHLPFGGPLNSYKMLGCGGFAGNSFMPIPYAKSLKIAVRGPAYFHHILYEQYPYGTPVDTFTGKEDRTALLQAFAEGGQAFCPSGLEPAVTEVQGIKAGKSAVLLDRKKAGTVRRIVITAEGSEAFLKGAIL